MHSELKFRVKFYTESSISTISAHSQSKIGQKWPKIRCNWQISKVHLQKLQSVQNMAASMVTGPRQRDRISPILEPVQTGYASQRIVSSRRPWRSVSVSMVLRLYTQLAGLGFGSGLESVELGLGLVGLGLARKPGHLPRMHGYGRS